jgi:hypothetical protein
MRRIASALVAAGGLWLARGAPAQEAAPPAADARPDLEFLEYLGSWQADDDEWLAIREWEQDNPPPTDTPPADAPPADGDRQREQRDGGRARERSRNEHDEVE